MAYSWPTAEAAFPSANMPTNRARLARSGHSCYLDVTLRKGGLFMSMLGSRYTPSGLPFICLPQLNRNTQVCSKIPIFLTGAEPGGGQIAPWGGVEEGRKTVRWFIRLLLPNRAEFSLPDPHKGEN